MKTCLYKPVFVNPQAYFVFPQLYDMQPKTDNFVEQAIFTGRLIITDLTNNQYTSYQNVNTIDFSQYADKRIKIEQYTDTGAVVLGEWIISQDTTGVKPIASYRAYDKTNNDTDRDILKDLTGNGHDIQLYNFEFAESSGYGKYGLSFSQYNNIKQDRAVIEFDGDYITIIKSVVMGFWQLFNRISSQSIIGEQRIKITNIPSGVTINYGYQNDDGETQYLISAANDGVYDIPSFTVSSGRIYGFEIKPIIDECNITIEQLPLYPNALVSDGVDDYGLCENFPIFTKEKGYTVCAIRKWLNIIEGYRTIASKYEIDTKRGAFIFEQIHSLFKQTYNYGKVTDIKKYFDNESLFSCQNSVKYNNEIVLEKGDAEDSNILSIFTAMNNDYGSAALYALEIYDRDLTDEEIATVKARMIAEYEEKTGNKYEEETV